MKPKFRVKTGLHVIAYAYDNSTGHNIFHVRYEYGILRYYDFSDEVSHLINSFQISDSQEIVVEG